MASWEREQLSPRLISPASAALARQPVKLNDGKEEPYGYGWDTRKQLGRAALSHSGQTAGFTAAYVRIPERRMAVVVFVNMYGGNPQTIALRALGDVDARLKAPAPKPIAETDPAKAMRVRQMLDAAASAEQDWREEWFTSEYWHDVDPGRPRIAAFYRKLGPAVRLTRVGNDDPAADADTVTYRVAYAKLSRIALVRFDKEGRIDRRDTRDE